MIHICNIRLYRAETGKANITSVAKPELFKLQKHKQPKITGAVIFSSALFTGSMSDTEMFRQCGIIPLLEQLIDSGYLQRGDSIMADRGRDVSSRTAVKPATVFKI